MAESQREAEARSTCRHRQLYGTLGVVSAVLECQKVFVTARCQRWVCRGVGFDDITYLRLRSLRSSGRRFCRATGGSGVWTPSAGTRSPVRIHRCLAAAAQRWPLSKLGKTHRYSRRAGGGRAASGSAVSGVRFGQKPARRRIAATSEVVGLLAAGVLARLPVRRCACAPAAGFVSQARHINRSW